MVDPIKNWYQYIILGYSLNKIKYQYLRFRTTLYTYSCDIQTDKFSELRRSGKMKV